MGHLKEQTVKDETIAPFNGIDGSGGSRRFGALVKLDEFIRWQ